MHLTQYIKGLPDKTFILVASMAIVLDAIVVLLILGCCGFLLSCWNLDSSFNYISSFLEIAIAINASCSFERIRKWIDKKRNSYVEEHIVPAASTVNVQITESIVDAVQPIHNAMQRIRNTIDNVTEKCGLITAIVVTILLVVGFTDDMKPFAILSMAPVLFFCSAVFVNYWFWQKAYERLQTDPVGEVVPVDDKYDLSIVAACTGPVSNETVIEPPKRG